jgi:hypothetical protein
MFPVYDRDTMGKFLLWGSSRLSLIGCLMFPVYDRDTMDDNIRLRNPELMNDQCPYWTLGRD